MDRVLQLHLQRVCAEGLTFLSPQAAPRAEDGVDAGARMAAEAALQLLRLVSGREFRVGIDRRRGRPLERVAGVAGERVLRIAGPNGPQAGLAGKQLQPVEHELVGVLLARPRYLMLL